MVKAQLKPGDPTPLFSATLQDGRMIHSSEWNDKKVILYFYPQDNTPTCTEEACNLRDSYHALIAAGYLVIGVSPDSPRKHQNFINKYKLPFDLISDPALDLIRLFGVWGPKKLFGREYDGVLRTTFILDHGRIGRILDEVKSKVHASQILDSAY
jgi:thioredoxin-dependent peroxiredoxin